ncbi:Imm21 family immunity protein [Myxococcus sp. 1LA]
MPVIQWIDSEGGPLIAIPRSCRADWTGILSRDYDDACGVVGYLGVLKRKWGQALLFGDAPMLTGVIHRPDGLALVRWVWGPSENEFLRVALHTELDGVSPTETLRVWLRDEPYVVFDSAAPGSEAESIEFTPRGGIHMIRTYAVNDEARQVSLVLHCLER